MFLGNAPIQKMFVGDTPVKKAYLGSMKIWPLYDAEVEYLESTGTEWIDTGVVPDFDTNVRFVGAYNFHDTYACITGTRTYNTNPKDGRYIPFGSVQQVTDSSARMVMAGSDVIFPYVYDGNFHEVIFNDSSHRCFFDDSLIATWTSGNTVTESNTLYIFGANGYGTEKYLSRSKVALYQIYKNNVLVRDFIPVRKGNVGYMYDRVSGKLFGNKGTGAFEYGRDIIPVEYLESTGAQWIETPIKISYREDFEVICEGQIINNSRVVWIGDFSNTSNRTVLNCEIGGTTNSHPRTSRVYYLTSSTIQDKYLGQHALNDNVSINMVYDAATHHVSATDGIVSIDTTLNIVYNATSLSLAMFRDHRTTNPTIIQNPTRLRRVVVRQGSTHWEFIPAKDENGVGFMFDKVSHTIYDNAGTGSFSYGPDTL